MLLIEKVVKPVLDPLMAKAARYLKRGKYTKALKILEPEVTRYRGFFNYHYLLGLVCLNAGDFGGAFTYFKVARDIKMRDPWVLLGIAVLYLRRKETDRAVDLYLEVLEVDEHNSTAKQALKVIRKFAGTDDLVTFVESGKLKKLYPPIPDIPVTASRIIISFLTVALIAAASFFLLVRFHVLNIPFFNQREGLDSSALTWEEKTENPQGDGTYTYTMNQQQFVDHYERARSFFNEYHDEKAKVELNRIFESNAPESIKTKARILWSYIQEPTFDSLKDHFTYSEVLAEPLLYRDCYVRWQGKAANLNAQQESTSFSFLIGYNSGNVIEGIVPVEFDFAIPVNIEQPIELLGQIVLIEQEHGMNIKLKGVAFHQSRVLVTNAEH
ncbi:MAG: tetratricopeptide repeat protein [Treponema sp.]|jgi:tetratricopeptide (TPR) repeat protein|nr:tetratricopeptide repeat protein [Treponema sp.]